VQRLLLAAVPSIDPGIHTGNVELKGEVPTPANPTSGSYFHPRCEYAVDISRPQEPLYREITPGL
jgi:peptide/nickel transport system ATP-binding protein